MATEQVAPKAPQDDPVRLRPLRPTQARQDRWQRGEELRWAELPDLTGYNPCFYWQSKPACQEKLDALAGLGFEPLRPLTEGEAKHLLAHCRRLARFHTVTPQQKAQLQHHGRWREGLTREEASKELWAAIGEVWASRDGPSPTA